MRKVLAFSVLTLLLVSSFFVTSAVEPDPLEQFIKTDNASLQRKALHQIFMNKAVYSKEVAQKIASCYRRKGPYIELSKLLYVAALIKCKEAVPVLEKIWLDRTSFGNDCIYCCPRSLVMTVLALHGLWTPHNLSANQRRSDQVGCTLIALESLLKRSPGVGSNEKPSFDGVDEEAILERKYLSFKDEQLLEIVTDPNATYNERDVASVELKSRIVDDHLLVDYYWWALNVCDDDSGDCLCHAHESILSAELYSSRHKH